VRKREEPTGSEQARPMQSVPVVVGQPIDATVASASSPPPRPSLVRRNTIMTKLLAHGMPPGLTKAMALSIEAFPTRFVVVDNSGSMQTMDGQRLVKLSTGQMKQIQASRWAELGDLVNEMAEVAISLGAETHFHLLNPTPVGQYFVVGDAPDETTGEKTKSPVGRAGNSVDAATIKEAMATSPNSTTPLTESLRTIIRLIAPSAPTLRANGQRCVVVLATDGLPNDQNSFLRALQDLQALQVVWLVVRLCTDEEAVVDYWDDLDKALEAPLETLDDVGSEAKEVARYNSFLTYAPSLHLARTMGLSEKLYDLLDEQALLPGQCKALVESLLGCAPLPEPELELAAFVRGVRDAQASLPHVYNPLTNKMCPWFDVGKLERQCKRGSPSSGGGCLLS